MPAGKEINLLPKDKFAESSLGKLVKWAVSVGRWIVVFTEFIVICAFLSRFYFDTQLANLFDELKQKQAMVDSAYSFEENFRQVQKKTQLVKSLLIGQDNPSLLISDVGSILPLNVSLKGVSLDEKTILISGSALSEKGLSTFLKALGTLPKISQVSLSNVSTDKETPSIVNFNVSATIKK